MSGSFHTPSSSYPKEKDSLERLGYLQQDLNESFSLSIEKMLAEGYSLLQTKRIEEALLMANVCLNTDLRCSDAWSLKGDCLIEQKKFSIAFDCYQKALEIDPKSRIDHFKMAYFQDHFVPRQTPSHDRKIKKIALTSSIVASFLFGALSLFLTFREKSASFRIHSSEKASYESSHAEPFQPLDHPEMSSSLSLAGAEQNQKNERVQALPYPVHESLPQPAAVVHHESILPLPLSDTALQLITSQTKNADQAASKSLQTELAPEKAALPLSSTEVGLHQEQEDRSETIQPSEPVSSAVVDIRPSRE